MTYDLSLRQTAERLGKSVRQVRYMIEHGQLTARKNGGRWVVEASDLPLSDGQKQARTRRDEHLKQALEEALDVGRATKRHLAPIARLGARTAF